MAARYMRFCCSFAWYLHAHPRHHRGPSSYCPTSRLENKNVNLKSQVSSTKKQKTQTVLTKLPSHHLRGTFIELSKILVVKDCKDELLVFVQILHHPPPFFHINQNGINHASKQEKEHHIKQAPYIPSHLGFRV